MTGTRVLLFVGSETSIAHSRGSQKPENLPVVVREPVPRRQTAGRLSTSWSIFLRTKEPASALDGKRPSSTATSRR
jgi:hypothetical protein